MTFIDQDRLVIEDTSANETLTASRRHDGSVYVLVENPWAGDNERGFGESAYITLTKDKADRLGLWLATGEHKT
jgi:hypothetical protein